MEVFITRDSFVGFVSVGAQQQAVPVGAGTGLARCETKYSSRNVKAFTSPRGCLTSQYSVFSVTKPESLGVIRMGLEVFTSLCGCETMQCYHGIPTTQANSARDISGSPHRALMWTYLKPDLNGEHSLAGWVVISAGDLNWLAAALGAGEHIAAR